MFVRLRRSTAFLCLLFLLFVAAGCGNEPEPLSSESTEDSTSQLELYPISFVLKNQTGFDLYEVQLSASGYENWQSDLLQDVLPNGGEIFVDFELNTPTLSWDIRIVDADGLALEYRELNFSECSVISLTISEGVPVAVME